jgi:hypothetical protein
MYLGKCHLLASCREPYFRAMLVVGYESLLNESRSTDMDRRNRVPTRTARERLWQIPPRLRCTDWIPIETRLGSIAKAGLWHPTPEWLENTMQTALVVNLRDMSSGIAEQPVDDDTKIVFLVPRAS